MKKDTSRKIAGTSVVCCLAAAVAFMLLVYPTQAQGTQEHVASQPMKLVLKESVAGMAGALGGGIVGYLIGSAICISRDWLLGCWGSSIFGMMIGMYVGGTASVIETGLKFGVRGNVWGALTLAVAAQIVGMRIGVQDFKDHLVIPAIATGLGATLGYNWGARVEARHLSLLTVQEAELLVVLVSF